MRLMSFIIVTFMAAMTSASASPAAWYIWKSKINQLEVCSQTNLGEGWEKWKGPFKDARCSIYGKPG